MGVPAIQNWKPLHEQVVGLHLAGNSNKVIAKATGYTPVRVSQILNDPRALQLIEAAQKRLRLRMQEDIENHLVVLAEESTTRLAETMNAEFVLGSKPKQHQDNVALSILKGTGFLSKDLGDNRQTDRPPLNEKLAERLVVALEKANTANKIQSATEEGTVIEAEVEIED